MTLSLSLSLFLSAELKQYFLELDIRKQMQSRNECCGPHMVDPSPVVFGPGKERVVDKRIAAALGRKGGGVDRL